MIEIKDLLGHFNNILLKEEMKKIAIKNVISSVIGVEINSKDIQLRNNTIFLNIKPIYKNEILIKKDMIFNQLSEFFNKNIPENIR